MIKNSNLPKKLLFLLTLFFFIIACNSSKSQLASKNLLVNVKEFGAKGNGKTDDSKAIIKADQYAHKNKKILFFPDGEYICFGIRPTSSWRGENKVILKSKNQAAKPVVDPFIYIKEQKNLVFENLHFDGNVTQDPKVWDEKTVNNFKGQLPLYVGRSKSIIIKNCNFSNAMKACLSIALSNDIEVSNCNFNHARSPFGDGIYVAQSYDIRINDCHATNYSRVGFTIEDQSHDITFNNCTATNGHYQSCNYGGTQYNAGFWIENSGDVLVENCSTSNNESFGFVVPFNVLKNKEHDEISLKNCLSSNTLKGFFIASGNHVAMQSSLYKCKSENCPVGFIITTRHDTDNITLDHCTANVKFDSITVNDGAFLWRYANKKPSALRPNINFTNCSISYMNDATEKIKNKKTNTADFACYDCGPVNINIDNCQNTQNDVPLFIKSRSKAGYFNIKNAKIEVVQAKRGTAFELDNVTYSEQTHNIFNSSKYKVAKKN